MKKYRWLSRSWLGLVYAFLYLPIVSLIVYSFNANQLTTDWGGFTLHWYVDIFRDPKIVSALWLSLKVGVLSATAATALGLLAALSLVRGGNFPGKNLFMGMVSAPLVMPEVIVGLAMLLLLVSVQKLTGFPDRGLFTIWIGHSLLCMAFATVVIESRLREVNRSIEEAAIDLGATPLEVFFLVTLPMISQALASAWLLAFTLSFDDVVLAAFLSGPGSTTLPIALLSKARLGVDTSINVVASLTVLVVGLLMLASSLYLARSQKRHQQEMNLAYKTAE